MTEPVSPPDRPPGPAARWTLRGAVAAATVAAAGSLLAATWKFAGGAVSLPACYALAGLAAGGAAGPARRWRWPVVAAALVVAVAGSDAASAGGATAVPGGVRGFIDPARVVWIPLPEGWVEAPNSRGDSPTGVVRRFRPAESDPDITARFEVMVHRTPNDSYARLQRTPGVDHLTRIRRGAAGGHRWRRIADGVGEVGMELHHDGWRIVVTCRGPVESVRADQRFERLRPEAERLFDRVLPLQRAFFDRLDRAWFGR